MLQKQCLGQDKLLKYIFYISTNLNLLESSLMTHFLTCERLSTFNNIIAFISVRLGTNYFILISCIYIGK